MVLPYQYVSYGITIKQSQYIMIYDMISNCLQSMRWSMYRYAVRKQITTIAWQRCAYRTSCNEPPAFTSFNSNSHAKIKAIANAQYSL